MVGPAARVLLVLVVAGCVDRGADAPPLPPPGELMNTTGDTLGGTYSLLESAVWAEWRAATPTNDSWGYICYKDQPCERPWRGPNLTIGDRDRLRYRVVDNLPNQSTQVAAAFEIPAGFKLIQGKTHYEGEIPPEGLTLEIIVEARSDGRWLIFANYSVEGWGPVGVDGISYNVLPR